MLIRKMLRDLKHHIGQFVAVFLLSALAMVMFTTFRSSDIGAFIGMDKFYESTNVAKAWVYGEEFEAEDAAKVRNVPGVTGTQLREALSGKAPDCGDAQVDLYLQDENRISMPFVTEGAPVDFGDKDSLWLSQKFAEAWNLAPGDQFTVRSGDVKVTKKIAGLILSPEYIYTKSDEDLETDFSRIAYVYMAREAWLEAEDIRYTQMLVTTDRENVLDLEEPVAAALEDEYAVFIDKSSVPGIRTFEDEIAQHEQFSYLFTIIFVVISVLLIMVTMRRIVEAQRTQIGTLNALGVKRWKISLHYVSFSFFVSLLGALVGLVIGPRYAGQALLDIFADWYILPDWKIGYDRSFYICFAVIVFASSFSAWLASRRLLRVEPAEALRPAPPKAGRHVIFEKLPFWEKLKFNVQYNLRDICRSKLRVFMSVLGVVCGMMFMVASFACTTSIDKTMDWSFRVLADYRSQIILKDDISLARADMLADEYEGELVQMSAIEVAPKEHALSEDRASCSLVVTENEGMYALTDRDLKPTWIREGEVALTMKLARKLGLSEGDTVWWHLYDQNEWYESKIGLINRNPNTSGITMLRKDYEKLDPALTIDVAGLMGENNGDEMSEAYGDSMQESVDQFFSSFASSLGEGTCFRPNMLLTDEKVSKEDSKYFTAVFTKEDLRASFERSLESIDLLVAFLVAFSFLFVVIVLYNAGNLSFHERQREFATLKVMGLSTRKIRELMTVQNLWLSILGAVIGAPLGHIILQYMLDSNGDSWDYQVFVSPLDYLLSFLLVVGTSVLVSFLFSRRIRDLDMVGALKGME